MARIFWANQAIMDYFRHLIENCSSTLWKKILFWETLRKNNFEKNELSTGAISSLLFEDKWRIYFSCYGIVNTIFAANLWVEQIIL